MGDRGERSRGHVKGSRTQEHLRTFGFRPLMGLSVPHHTLWALTHPTVYKRFAVDYGLLSRFLPYPRELI